MTQTIEDLRKALVLARSARENATEDRREWEYISIMRELGHSRAVGKLDKNRAADSEFSRKCLTYETLYRLESEAIRVEDLAWRAVRQVLGEHS